MKFKKIMLVTFLLLALLIGAVSASDGADNLTAVDVGDDELNIDESPLDEVILTEDSYEAVGVDNDASSLGETLSENQNDVDYTIHVDEVPEEIYIGDLEKYTINLTLPENATGKLVVYEETYFYEGEGNYPVLTYLNLKSADAVNGVMKLNFKEAFGERLNGTSTLLNVFIKYEGSDYSPEPYYYSMNFLDYSLLGPDKNVIVGETANFTIRILKDVTGFLQIYENNALIQDNVTIKDGCATVSFESLTFGGHGFDFVYVGDDYYLHQYRSFSVLPKELNLTGVSQLSGGDVLLTLKMPGNASGNLALNFYSYDLDKKIKINTSYDGGIAIIKASDLPVGNWMLINITISDEKYGTFEMESFNEYEIKDAVIDPKIEANDLSVQYNTGKYYSVTVYGTDGKVASNVEVIYELNGKQIAKAITNENGVAKFKVTQTPVTKGKLTVKALGVNVTKELTVKRVVSLKKVTVKRSASKLLLTATLKKVNGKYLINKKIIFKFNGKKYTAMTNKKGVAKVTIKKSVLKKLKAGKKITYTATYVKDTVKQTVIVKK